MKNFTETVHYQEMLDAITRHFKHAVEKHPCFCHNKLHPLVNLENVTENLMFLRKHLDSQTKSRHIQWNTVLQCEILEIQEAIATGDDNHAIEECCDAIAVLMRVICVLKGYQQLGNPE